MDLKKIVSGMMLSGAVLALAACNSYGGRHASADGYTGQPQPSSVLTQGVGEPNQFYAQQNVQTQRQARNKQTLHFDFDRFDLRGRDEEALQAHAAYLRANPGARIRIEGHTDERGTREYNIALGERRANTVANYLRLQGVRPDQMSTVSYGEEKPVTFNHDENAWQENRRAKISYLNEK
jgi:peptidoglycan-associated lipoprotein